MGSPAGSVECASCGHANPSDARFCGDCGARLGPEPCPSCGHENPPGQRFCNSCGSRLESAADREPEPAASTLEALQAPGELRQRAEQAAAEASGELKQASVLFADVAGSMDLAESADPERWREVMDGFFTLLADAVHRYEGTVDKFTGDGIMALFGAPIAHEDHARRACLAALEMLEAVAAGEAGADDELAAGLSVRIGINSGAMVIGSLGERGSLEYTAVGHTVGLAQRMEALADPGTVLVTEHTAALVTGFLELEDRGEQEVRGSAQPVRAYALRGVGEARDRIDVELARGLTPLVGREAEMAELREALSRAERAAGQVIGIVGRPGVGKSRLCHELVELCRERGVPVYGARCEAHARDVPLRPVLQMQRGYFGIDEGEDPAAARNKVSDRLLPLDSAFAQDLPLIWEFLGIADPDQPVPQMNAQARQRRLTDLVRRMVLAQGRVEPALCLVEDLHWIDPVSELFLAALVDAVPDTRTLVVVNMRPEYRAEWMGRTHYRQFPLAPLADDGLEALLNTILGEDPSLDGLHELVAERTDGTPFFVEEVVRELVENGALAGERGSYRLVADVGELTVPPTVQAVLAARIDRLSDRARAALHAAAVIGAEFPLDVLVAVSGSAQPEIEDAVHELVAAEFVREISSYPRAEYAFSHPLTREVALETQLESHRRGVHLGVAEALQRTEAGHLDESAGMIAEHLAAGGEAREAAEWHARAAAWAGTNAPAAARSHWQAVLALDDRLGEGEEADRLRLAARIMVLNMSWRLGGEIDYLRQLFSEGIVLTRHLNDPAPEGLLYGLMGISEATLAGNVAEFGRLAAKAIEVVDSIEDPAMRVAILTSGVYPSYITGELDAGLAVLDRVIEMTEDDHTLGEGIVVGNPRAWAISFRSWLLIPLGRFDEAWEALREGTAACERWDREALSWSYSCRASMATFGGEPPGAESVEAGRRALELADELGDSFSQAIASIWLAAAGLELGRVEEAVRLTGQTLAMIETRKVGLEFVPIALTMRARAHHAAGRLDQALRDAERACSQAEAAVMRTHGFGAHNALAHVLVDLGSEQDLGRAAALLDEAEAEQERLKAIPARITTLRIKARLASARGDAEAAAAAQEKALALARECGALGHLAALERPGASAG
jgi:class 3 adenylate cyclase/tetratricopeptide (TPR) repeat protein